MSCKAASIIKSSIAEELGIKAGSCILSINGKKLRDYIDYQFLTASEELEIEIESPDGSVQLYEIEKDFDEDLGFVFESAVFDKIKPCANKCIFCFVDQQPAGLRPSLYIKDDDYRLSYLQGSYITLTNLTKKDKERIASMHLGPLYISVHTLNPDLRVKMMRNKKAADILKELDFLKENDIPIHTQIVLCPGCNDGLELKKTLEGLLEYKKILLSITVVPIGITKYRKEQLEPVSKEKAAETIEIIDNFNKKIKKQIACASDEFFLLAEKELPEKAYYNGYPQLDDGAGSLRYLIDDFNKRIKKAPKAAKSEKKFTLACSVSAQDAFLRFAQELNKIKNVHIDVIPVKNDFWGSTVNVSGLITGADLIKQLKGRCGKNVIIPAVMLRPYTDEFLDEITVKDIEKELKIKLHIIKDSCSTEGLFELLFQ